MNVNMKSILSLSSGQPVKVDVRLDGAHWSVKSMAASKSRKDNGHSPVCCRIYFLFCITHVRS